MSPRVTVLLAVHNGEPFLRRCLDSVLAQTYDDFELLVVDDASTDATPATISSFADPRVRVLRNETNLGQVPSLNRGLREARGEYVARIDADDWCKPARLARQVDALDAEPRVAVVGTWMDAVDEQDRPAGKLRSTIDDFAEFLFHTLIMRVYVAHPAAMFRRVAVVGVGGYDESTGPAEDKDLWRRLALERWDARIVPEPLVVYRLHAAQLSQVRATYQRDVDGRSQDRFLAALAPGADVRPLRLLLSGDDDFWRERHGVDATLRTLEDVLSGARQRLELRDEEVERVRRLLAPWLLGVARRRPWRRGAWTLAGPARRSLAPALAYAPVRAAARRGTTLPGLRRLGRVARRSRTARAVYGKFLGDA
jgi:glycosyltransferase involved in cell wall biosynthesis